MEKFHERTAFGSYERFNRVLYGGHAQDRGANRFFTFAGDTPIFMGASSDYTGDTWCSQAKNGVLMSGLAMTPGHVEGTSRDSFSCWFHECSDTAAEWRHGCMSYELTRFSSYFPDVRVKMEILPLNPDDGYLVRYEIRTDQRVIFCAGFGGITPFFGRFEYHTSARRDFSREDALDNVAELHDTYASVRGPGETTMLIGTDFDCRFETDDASAMEERFPSLFLTGHGGDPRIVRIRRVLLPGENFTGHIAVIRNASPEALKRYLSMPDPCRVLRGKIREKYAAAAFCSPDAALNRAFTDTIIAQDASFHGNSFYHGAIGYHTPFLGWRGWYAPILLGWSGRVRAAILSHFDTITRSDAPERVWWDGADRPDLDHEGTQYHRLENTRGRLTALLHRDDIYDMQEVAVDMTLYYFEHTGDLETCGAVYDRLCEVLDWQERILDPDGDGLYQNFLNTWISDGHSYNGGACAQASSYNCAANLRTATLGKLLGRDTARLEARAARIREAFLRRLWLEKTGVPAEFIDTIGNRLVHPSPELSTIYLAADCGITDLRQNFRMLRWVERNIASVRTAGRRGGRLYYSSNWKPKKYSTCGLFPAENACLALAFFQTGLRDRAMEIVNGIADGFDLSPYPGSITHIFAASGAPDGGDIDFTDVSSCWLRLLIEGLWGVRFRRTEKNLTLTPQLPDSWENASLSLPELSISLTRSGESDLYSIALNAPLTATLRIPMRRAAVEQLFLNGREHSFTVEPGIGASFLEIRTEPLARLELRVWYADADYPALEQSSFASSTGNVETLRLSAGTIGSVTWFGEGMRELDRSPRELRFRVETAEKITDALVEARLGETRVLLPAEVSVRQAAPKEEPKHFDIQEKVELSPYFNASLTEIHRREFRSPRPAGYSIGARLNGRYAWEWNHYGHNALVVDDSGLRGCGGELVTASGLRFASPAEGHNAVTVSIWENFPTALSIPLAGKAAELDVLLCGTTNAMQSYVVNGRLKVIYEDGAVTAVDLIPPENFDDFLVAAFQTGNETVYFSDGTHGMVQKIALDPAKTLRAFEVEAVANEVIVNILALTLRK